MDHGILNTPIGSRARGGSIDAQIDRHKKTAARQLAAASRARHDTRKAAAAALKAAPDAKLLGLAQKTGLTIVQVRNKLRSECVSSPHMVLTFLTEKTLAQGGAA